jgi:peptidoglycan hydrolase-like protein with peptidoglycan-binding domain
MTLTPTQARSAFGGFLLVASLIAANILYFQDGPDAQSAHAIPDRSVAPSAVERQRRLALAPGEGALPKPAERRVAPIPPTASATSATTVVSTPSQQERVGRFAPPAARASVMRLPRSEAEGKPSEVVKSVQQALADRGYEPGVADGVVGLATRAAIMAYEDDHSLPVTAEPSEQLLAHIRKGAALQPAARAAKAGRTPEAQQIVRSVQQSLAMLGYFAGPIDGVLGDDTVKAIREYEVDSGLVPTGRVSAPLLQKIARTMNASSMRAPN